MKGGRRRVIVYLGITRSSHPGRSKMNGDSPRDEWNWHTTQLQGCKERAGPLQKWLFETNNETGLKAPIIFSHHGVNVCK